MLTDLHTGVRQNKKRQKGSQKVIRHKTSFMRSVLNGQCESAFIFSIFLPVLCDKAYNRGRKAFVLKEIIAKNVIQIPVNFKMFYNLYKQAIYCSLVNN
jgi:hypothetical protein